MSRPPSTVPMPWCSQYPVPPSTARSPRRAHGPPPAIPGPAIDALLGEQAEALAGRLVLDAANRIGGGGPANIHDAITAKVPGVRYARVFNSLGVENLADPRFGDAAADMFFSAPPADQAAVEELITAVGLRPVYLGDGQQDVVDGVLRLWFALVMGQGHSRQRSEEHTSE